jgi:DNA-binding CsgD family transcriptional regulator
MAGQRHSASRLTVGIGELLVVVELLERHIEAQIIDGVLDSGREGRGAVVVLEAAAGLGKTALLRYASEAATAAGMVTLRARAAELERDFAFGVLRQLFEPLVTREGDRLLIGAAAATAGLFKSDPAPGDSDCGGALYPLLNGLYWLLVNIATTPVAIVVDDVQWADEPSLRFLGFLARRLEPLPVTVIVAIRAGEPADWTLLADITAADAVTIVEPKCLSPTAVAELVRQRLGPDVDNELCLACHAATGGNPLYVSEVLRALAREPAQPTGAAAAELAITAAGPNAIRPHVAARLRRLSPAAQRVAASAAILGDDTKPSLVAQHAEIDLSTAMAAIDALVQHGLLADQGQPAYVHALVRDAVMALIPPGARSEEHDRAARVLAAAGEPVERVASHLLRTVPQGQASTVQLLLQAADEVRRRGAPEGAAVYLSRARDEPPPVEQRAEVSRMLGNCLAYRLSLDDAERLLREAVTLAQTSEQRALAAFSLARFRNACGDPREAVDILLAATAATPAERAPMLAAAMEAELVGFARVDLHGRALMMERFTEYGARPDRAPEVVDAQGSLEAVFDGESAEVAVDLAVRALSGDRLPPDKSALWVAVHTLLVADRLDEADQYLERAVEHAADRGMLLPVALTRGYQARVALLRGELRQARAHVELGIEAAPGRHFALPLLQSTLVHLLIEDGKLDEADAVVASGVLAAGRLPGSSLEVWLLDARIRLRLEQDEPAAALADAREFGRIYQVWGAQRLLDVPWRLRAAEALAVLGDAAAAARLVAEHESLAETFGVARHIGLATAAAARLAEPADRIRLARRAVELLDGTPGRLDLARALEQLAAYEAAANDRRASRNTLRRAAEAALACGASDLAIRLRARLAAGGGRPPRIRVSGVHSLTPSERQVATLAAKRLTNRQIAERLYVTEKTVESHLSRVYRKLQVDSRIQLAAQLATATPEEHG